MNVWVLGIGTLYLGALVYAALRARASNRSDHDFLTAGSNLGSLFGCLTVAATLFSTFTLMGMPDLFRNHGVGAWFFLGISDCALAFVALWFGVNIRKRMVVQNFNGFSGWLSKQYNSRYAAYVYLLGIFVFLVPYVAIQIKGISLFLNSIMPAVMPSWAWSITIVSLILIYSEIGGLKAIIFADSIQGLTLFAVTLIVAVGCVAHFGGVGAMFDAIESSAPALLSLPGPAGLFTYQFLIASFLAIVMIPVTQPQMSIRLVIMRDTPSLARMAVLLGLFSFVLILATLPIGLYGAALYPDDTTANFVAKVLVHDQSSIVAAIVIVGLIAAAISTADSQLFALGSELRSGASASRLQSLSMVRGAVLVFALAALVVSLVSNTHIVLLARTSFAGTSLLAPMILAAVFFPARLHRLIPLVVAIGLIVFLASISGVVDENILGWRVDLVLFVSVALATATILALNGRNRTAE
ncbi:MAG: sodium:solute symporter family protein [Woeseiaceae bacterium]|nr:sodium:solute symporter family protein [Woeseiaceae bacterium]